MKNICENERGSLFVFFAVAIVVLGMFVGLAIDSGRAYLARSELERTVDSAALAAASRLGGGLSAAQAAACNAARMNGVACGALAVSTVTVNDASGNPVNGVQVTANAVVPTTFMRLGKLAGCGSGCDSLSTSASAVAAPGGKIDLVLNLDDTGSMDSGSPTWISQAKIGARTLVDSLVPAGVTSAHPTRVSLVPFRGCYHTNASGSTYGDCEDLSEYPSSGGDLVSLSYSNTNLRNAINALNAAGGSGTNNCEGLLQSRRKLFQAGVSRTDAQKFMIVLTDAQSSYNSSPGASFTTKCRPSSGGNQDQKVNLLAYNVAQDIKYGVNVTNDGQQWGVPLSPSGSGQSSGQTVEVFVILYNGGSGPAPATCNAPAAGTTAWNTTPQNLARCMASSAANVYFAPTATQIVPVFQQILSRLPVKMIR